MRKNYKKLTAVALTVAMTMGSAMTTFAAGDMTGTGGFEGGEMKYPTISVTLPTVPEGINYIADPNGLISATKDASGDAAKTEYQGYDFNGNTGIYFKTSEKSGDVRGVYSQDSANMVFTNENAQDLNVTVTLSKTSEASGDVVYSDSASFASGDAARKLYLAVTDGTTTKALSGSADASFTAEIPGTKDNFEAKYDGTKYGYAKKSSGDLVAWQQNTYKLTGALNTNAKWTEDSIDVPDIKVTWAYEEKPTDAAPSIEDITYSKASGTDLVIPYSVGAGESGADALTDVLLKFDASTFHSKNGTWGTTTRYASSFTIGANSITISKDYLTYVSNGAHQLIVIFDNDDSTMQTIDVTIQP